MKAGLSASLISSLLLVSAFAQSPGARFSISGIVSDPTGAAVPGASVLLRQLSGAQVTKAATTISGGFRLDAVPTGSYRLEVTAPGLTTETVAVAVPGRSPAPLRITLNLAGVRQEVTVNESTPQVGTDASDNLDVVTLDRDMLDNLPIFDQNYVAAMSQFLDPGAIGTSGVTLVVNGMEQKNIGVSASAIQQVKINQNPYSAEFSRPGRGRIEIITKPGSQQLSRHVQLPVPRLPSERARPVLPLAAPPEQRRIYEGSLIGPLGHSGKNSFLLSVDREEQDLQSVVFASTPSGVFQQNVANPQRNTEFAAGITHQFSDNHLASFRGNYRDTTEKNRGVGGFVLPEAAYNFRRPRRRTLLQRQPGDLAQAAEPVPRPLRPAAHPHHQRQQRSRPSWLPASSPAAARRPTGLQTETHINLNEIVSWSPWANTRSARRHQRARHQPPRAGRPHQHRRHLLVSPLCRITLRPGPTRSYSSRATAQLSSSKPWSGGFFQDDYQRAPQPDSLGRRSLRLAEFLPRQQQRRAAPLLRLRAVQKPQDRAARRSGLLLRPHRSRTRSSISNATTASASDRSSSPTPPIRPSFDPAAAAIHPHPSRPHRQDALYRAVQHGRRAATLSPARPSPPPTGPRAASGCSAPATSTPRCPRITSCAPTPPSASTARSSPPATSKATPWRSPSAAAHPLLRRHGAVHPRPRL